MISRCKSGRIRPTVRHHKTIIQIHHFWSETLPRETQRERERESDGSHAAKVSVGETSQIFGTFSKLSNRNFRIKNSIEDRVDICMQIAPRYLGELHEFDLPSASRHWLEFWEIHPKAPWIRFIESVPQWRFFTKNSDPQRAIRRTRNSLENHYELQKKTPRNRNSKEPTELCGIRTKSYA